MNSLAKRLVLPQARVLNKISLIQKNDFSSSSATLGSLSMPERLQHIPDAEVINHLESRLTVLIIQFLGSRLLRDG